MNAERLLNAALAVREANRPTFSMRWLVHPCGTPSCVLGEYAARPDLQSEFCLTGGALNVTEGQYSYLRILQHFDITQDQEEELFGACGCGYAMTPAEAANYIERFVAKHIAAQLTEQETDCHELFHS